MIFTRVVRASEEWISDRALFRSDPQIVGSRENVANGALSTAIGRAIKALRGGGGGGAHYQRSAIKRGRRRRRAPRHVTVIRSLTVRRSMNEPAVSS